MVTSVDNETAVKNISKMAQEKGCLLYTSDLVDESGETVDEMLDAIAERYFKINCAVFTPNDQRMKDIVQMAKDLHVDGIVDVALQFCTLYEMESFAVEKAANGYICRCGWWRSLECRIRRLQCHPLWRQLYSG